jgi:multiple sugar transport system ATP-binding protein
MASVLLENVSKVFDGGVVAVSDLDIEVEDREFMVIVGPSGCGKTTILRMIAGLEDVTAGTIKIGGDVVNDAAPENRDVAMVFQNYALYPHMTVYENMAFSLKVRRTPRDRIESAVEDTAKMLGIEGLLARKPKELSGGQRQRVALGRAIVRKPKVFLFDEPLSNLDAKLRATTRAELKTLHRRLETTCIYVTHDQTEAMTLGGRICVINRGVVQQIAPPMEVYDRPINRFVAGFVGSPAMNFFEGRIELRANHAYFLAGGNNILLADDCVGQLRRYNGKPMVLGLRPEHISLKAFANSKENTLDCRVRVVEPLGDRTEVILETEDDLELTTTIAPHIAIKPGDAAQAHIHTAKAHIFEPGEAAGNVIAGC